MISTQFNARNASPKDIASSFVMPEYFEQAAAYQNLVLVGPRGLGKTTIMKALTATGLYYLHQREEFADRLRRVNFEYIPVYIPAESIWKGTAQLVSNLEISKSDRDLILNGLFTDHCLYQLIASFEDARFVSDLTIQGEAVPWAAHLTDVQESQICEMCSELWSLPTKQFSFIGLKLALLKRINMFRSAVSPFNSSANLDTIRLVGHLDFLVMLKGFFDAVESQIGVHRWSVSFDEMEIAPKRVLTRLYENLRSFDQRAVLKFSLFPYIDFYDLEERLRTSETGPVDGQDFHSIILANKFADADHKFSKELIQKECENRGIAFSEFVNYLNNSSAIKKDTRKFVSKGFERQVSAIYTAAKSAGDKSFIEHMANNDFKNVSDIDGLRGENLRASYLRKVAPIAEIRSYYFSKADKSKTRQSSTRRRSAKGYGYYHGFDQLLSLTEGNPRAVKYLLNELFVSFNDGVDSRIAQNRAIPRNVDRFRALIASYNPSVKSANEVYPTLAVVDRLGETLSENLFDSKFQPEPALSYRLKGVSTKIRDALIIGINSGALVVDQRSDGKQLIFDLEGCRLRISHRLAPFYKLPTITGQERVLSAMPHNSKKQDEQPDLLNWATEDA
ncbi:ORC-CDC6 family AAA ATPase [Pseudovibrio sp. Alg231-02]|uniref:ORC-CDC6 family AAA ATPase n=1 Tax=Pseudovibrio sp. Alg231-02 TaxID=1922223 RepID=UPI000D55C16C|nr:hypothetical protein [Pseudovibrio sp. Alg231-02]